MKETHGGMGRVVVPGRGEGERAKMAMCEMGRTEERRKQRVRYLTCFILGENLWIIELEGGG